METPTLAGEVVTIGDFSAFKALYAMEIIGAVEETWREVLHKTTEIRVEYESTNVLRTQRVEARRMYRPRPLYGTRRVMAEDGETVLEIIDEPVMQDGETVLGPDPLGHLTEDDWQACGNVLEQREQPSDEWLTGAMLPLGFKMARTQALRLIALALTPNRTLEDWDGEQNIEAKLDEEAKRIVHRASAGELIRLAGAVMLAAKDQLRGPFEEARQAWQQLRPQKKDDETPAIEPMRLETETPTDESDGSGSSATSSTESQDDTAGTPSSSSIEPAPAAS